MIDKKSRGLFCFENFQRAPYPAFILGDIPRICCHADALPSDVQVLTGREKQLDSTGELLHALGCPSVATVQDKSPEDDSVPQKGPFEAF